MKKSLKLLSLFTVAVILISACASAARNADAGRMVEYSLTTGMADGKMAFIGVGGGIDGVTNPALSANVGDTLKLTLSSGDGVEHDITFPDFNATSEHVVSKGSSTTLTFLVDKGGSFSYHCVIAGHREAGMEGKFEVTGETANTSPSTSSNVPVAQNMPVVAKNPATAGADIVRDPTDLPGPIGNREPQTVMINLEATEVEGQLADGTTYTYWTFNKQVPGPFFRVRVGDTLEVHMKNSTNSTMAHSMA